jgi:hypothetical protein
MNIHHIDDQIYYSSSTRRQDGEIYEEGRRPAHPSPAEGDVYPANMMHNYPSTLDQDNFFSGVESARNMSFGEKLDLCRRRKSEEYERASQRWADCSSEEWLAGSDGEYSYGNITSG